jgi:endo-1,4-beta-xylanase
MSSHFFKMRRPLILKVITLVAVFILAMATQTNAGLATTKFLGNIISTSVPSNFSNYWDQVTPENGGKWGTVEGSRGNMNWDQCDIAYNYARSHSFPFKFHCLVWGSQQPSWISGLSAADQKAEVMDWIKQAGARYSGAQMVDVVNEPLHTTPPYANAIGGSGSTGWDWIVWSFEQARVAFPNSKLLINEYGIISDPNAASRYISIINILKNRGLVDGIGIQCHYFNMDTVSTSTMRSVLSSLAATGLPIYVSELDMTGDDATQKARYQEKFPVLWENSAVAGITLWGYIEGQTWASGTHLITSSGVERPALQWLRQYLSSIPTPTPTPTTTLTPTPTPTPTGCSISYSQSDWGSGATVSITINNNSSSAIDGWTLAWNFTGNQQITNMWNGTYTQSGTAVTVKNVSYNNIIPAKGSVSLGFNITYSGTNAKPTNFTLNGTSCQIE